MEQVLADGRSQQHLMAFHFIMPLRLRADALMVLYEADWMELEGGGDAQCSVNSARLEGREKYDLGVWQRWGPCNLEYPLSQHGLTYDLDPRHWRCGGRLHGAVGHAPRA